MTPIYILSARQISVQAPLTEAWTDNPRICERVYERAQEPDYKQYISPVKLRRMGLLLRRAVVCAQEAVKQAGGAVPEAIISGTGLGCIENTEHFLTAMLNEGEELLQPTSFMQSTHNTISSQIAIDLHCHGYNTTYSHKFISFESALFDAFMQMRENKLRTALVGGYDEMTRNYQLMLGRLGYWRIDGEDVIRRDGEPFAGETSVSLMLGTDEAVNSQSLCRLADVKLLYQPTISQLHNAVEQILADNGISKTDAVITGKASIDADYQNTAQQLFPDTPLLSYKPVFGESYTAAGLATYAGAVCLSQDRIPQCLFNDCNIKLNKNISSILIYHQYEHKHHTFILLTK